MVWVVNKLRQFLLGLHFVIYTDCQALVYLNLFKGINAQVAHWHGILQEFKFLVKYRPGTRMSHVDALSRAPVGSIVGEEIPVDSELKEIWDVCVLITIDDKVLMCQTADEELSELIRSLGDDLDNSGFRGKNFVMEGGLLYRKVNGKLLFVMPRAMRKSLVVAAHDLKGHPAVDRTVANILQDF